MKAKQITRAGLVFVATAVYAGAGTTPPPTTTPPPPTTAPAPPPDGTTAAQRGVAWYQANTGIQSGHTLTTHAGNWTLSSSDSGKTFNDISVTGVIDTTSATNVTFNNVRAYRVQNPNGGGGTTYNHCELDGSTFSNTNDTNDNGANDGTYNFCNVHDEFRGIQWSKFVREGDTWIHDLRPLGTTTHRCSTATNGMDAGGSAVIERDWLEAGNWSALSGEICMYGDFNPVHDVTIDGSVLVDSGSYQMYAGSLPTKAFPHGSNIHITNNAFWPTGKSGPPGSQYGYVFGFENANGNTWSGNTVLSTGALIPSP